MIANPSALSPDQPVVVLDAGQAGQILRLLTVCVDLLATSPKARAGLAGSLSMTVPDQTPNVDGFVDQLGFSRRYLDARLARSHTTTPVPVTAGKPIQERVS